MAEIDRNGKTNRSGRVCGKLRTLQQRLEGSILREAVISGLILVILLIGVVWNLPDSEVKRRLTPTLQPIASAAGLEQSWRMYAPEPIRQLEIVEVHVTMADGARRVWTNPPRGDRVIGPFAWYRWQKLKEQAVREPASRAGLAQWVVRELTGPAERAISVEMILHTKDLPAPGSDGPIATAVQTLYQEELTSRP